MKAIATKNILNSVSCSARKFQTIPYEEMWAVKKFRLDACIGFSFRNWMYLNFENIGVQVNPKILLSL